MVEETRAAPDRDWLRYLDTLRHELKTPLTSIIAAAGLLAEELETSEASHRKLIQNIMHNATTLDNRLGEFFEIIKTGDKGLQLELAPVDMKSLLQGVTWQVSPLLQSKHQTQELQIPEELPILRGDGKKLEQVVLNLMTNAAKFTPQGGAIKLSAIMRDGELLINVQDNGIGISAEEQTRLFKPYSRLNADRREQPGLGLGLALAKQVVELHKGKIWVESTPGKGSTFTFSLPVS
ncbi:MAG: HAMP domain-containing sensor histidine kinase [Chloroflexota bacterium]